MPFLVLLEYHEFASPFLLDDVPGSTEPFNALISEPHACFYSKFAKTQLKIHTFHVLPVLFSFFFDTKLAPPTCNLTLDINASFSRKRNLPFFWYRHIKPWGAWRQLHWLETSVPLISPRPPEPVQANGARIPSCHTHLRHICTPQFKGTQTWWHEQNYIGIPLHYHRHHEFSFSCA